MNGIGFKQQRADERVATLAEGIWQKLSCGQGAKGSRLYDWNLLSLSRFGQEADVVHALLARRSLTTGELAYFVVFTPASTSLKTILRVVGRR